MTIEPASRRPDDEYNLAIASHGSTSRSLLIRARANDAEAWDRLVALYAPLVMHWCRRWQLSVVRLMCRRRMYVVGATPLVASRLRLYTLRAP